MFFEIKLQQSLTARSEQISIYDEVYSALKQQASVLFELRQSAIQLLDRVHSLTINSTGDFSTFGNALNSISIEQQNFIDAKQHIQSPMKVNQQAEVIGSITKAVAPLAREYAPDIAMWATTFGKASTGKAVSELSGIARKNAQLAILGGGAKRIGGKGIEGGKAFLAIVGPLAEVGIIGVSTAAIVFIRCKENYQNAKQAYEQSENVRQATSVLVESIKHIKDLINQTNKLLTECNDQLIEITDLQTSTDPDVIIEYNERVEKLIVNSSKLASLINQTI